MTKPSANRSEAPQIRPQLLVAISWYSEALHEGIARYAVEHGFETILWDEKTSDELASKNLVGVVSGLPEKSYAMHRFVVASGLPVVELSLSYPERNGWCRCPSDSVVTGRLAADYLRRRPVASLAFVTYGDNETSRVREKHFMQLLTEEREKRPVARHVYFDPAAMKTSTATRLTHLADFLRELPKPAGVFGVSDTTARLVCDAAGEAGLSVPGDLFVMGYGNRRLISEIAPTPITTIAVDYAAWGYAATAMLHELITGRVAPGTVKPFAPGGIIERESTGGASGGDPLCTEALKLMRKHQARPLSVSELASRLKVSPATLKRSFAQAYGVGVAEKYLALRIETAKGLLTGGDKVEVVADAIGFSSARSLRKAFIRLTNVTPGGFSGAK